MSLFNFDPVGTLVANKILNEPHVISAINGFDHSYIIPVNAPFYDASLSVVDASGNTLVPGVDYIYIYTFMEATIKTGQAVSGGLAFLDPNTNGTFNINYQTVGGQYVNDTTQAISNGVGMLDDLTSRSWYSIGNVPLVFPPTPHTARLDNFVGISEILAKLSDLEVAIRSPDRHIMVADIVDLDLAYIEPLTTGMASIAVALDAISGSQKNYYVDVNNGDTYSDIAVGAPNVWLDTGLEATTAFEGSFAITFGGNPVIVVPSNDPKYELRFVINDTVVIRSPINGAIVGLQANAVVGLQIRVLKEQATLIQISGDGVTCGLSLVRITG